MVYFLRHKPQTQNKSMEKTNIEWFYWAKEQGYEWAQSAIDQCYCPNDKPTYNGKV